jgi:hypothetical protein
VLALNQAHGRRQRRQPGDRGPWRAPRGLNPAAVRCWAVGASVGGVGSKGNLLICAMAMVIVTVVLSR